MSEQDGAQPAVQPEVVSPPPESLPRRLRSTVRGFARKVYLAVFRYSNPVLVPLENRLINWYARLFPRRFAAGIDRSIDRGLAYFEAIEDWQVDSLVAFTQFVDERLEPRLAMAHAARERFLQTWRDPFIRVLDPQYDPERDGVGKARAYALPENPSERRIDEMMLKCAYADREGRGPEFIAELETLADDGGYGTTHILIGAAMMRDTSNIEAETLDRAIERTIAPIVRAQRRDRICDLFCERTAFLLWQGYGKYVEPAWIVRIVRGQLEDGGWFWYKPPLHPPSAQHPTCLAVSALLLYRAGYLH